MQLLQPCLSDIMEETSSDDSGSTSPTDTVCWATSPIETPPLGRRRRCRTQFSGADLSRLESAFSSDPYPDVRTREQLADLLRVTEDRVQVWFQNHRAKVKRRLMTARRSTKITPTRSHPTHPAGIRHPPAAQPSRDGQEGWQHPALTCLPPVGSCGGPLMPGGVIQRVQRAAVQGYGDDVRMSRTSPPLREKHQRHHPAVGDHRREYVACDPSPIQEEMRPLTTSTPNPPLSICEVTSTSTKDAAMEKTPTSPYTTHPHHGGISRTNKTACSRVGTTGHSTTKFKPRRPWEDEPRGPGMKRLLEDVDVDSVATYDVNHNQFHYVNAGQHDVAATGQLYIDTEAHFRSPFYFPHEIAGMQCLARLSVYPNMCNMGGMQSEQYGQLWPLYKGSLTARL